MTFQVVEPVDVRRDVFENVIFSIGSLCLL
jgi:hypothetical protein